MDYKVYIIEDDKSIGNLLKEYINKYGYISNVVEDFANIVEEVKNFEPHIILLDINLPSFDGFYWCNEIRKFSKVPIIFISARDSGMDQVMAIESGGDDYITKPFYYEVVMAKIKSHIRRVYGDYAPKVDERIVEVGELIYYPERYEVQYKDRTKILTKKEGVLLESLLKKYPKVVSRDFLLEKIWDDLEFVEENTLNVNVSRIRKRLSELGIENGIETVRGEGYRINKTW